MSAVITHDTANGKIFAVVPNASERIRPLTHVGRARDYFSRFPSLVAAVNGTFFEGVGSPRLTLFGDLKTEIGLRGQVPARSFHTQGDFFWQPAAEVDKAGYGNRWAMAESNTGEFHLLQHQPKSFAEYASERWALGGGAALLRAGEAIQSTASLKTSDGGGFSDQLRAARRSCLAVKDRKLHLILAGTMQPRELAVSLRDLGYSDALMLDGGGAATLITRGATRLEALFEHRLSQYPVLQSMVGVVRND